MTDFNTDFNADFGPANNSGNPFKTTWGDILKGALKDAGALGVGMIPLSEDLMDASDRGVQLLQQWERKRWLVYHLVTYIVQATGQGIDGSGNLEPYTIGPVGGPDTPQIAVGLYGFSARPNRLEQAFFRQLLLSPTGPVDYPLRILPSFEDYNTIALKGLTNFSRTCYYDNSWPLGKLYLYPWPQANIYAVGLTFREQLPASFGLGGNPLATQMNLPFEYYRALRTNIALEVRPKYGIIALPGDRLEAMAKDSRECLRGGNTQIPLLGIPPDLANSGGYNIYSDQGF